ncbi:hypothetical protein [Gaoshiqia sp. Z1-71]|uniref:hypothetical protein n=1 Tax=Gaoshiqia hydrogeniformans TaxID=3290090 RepID=UPI003BF7FB19
MTTESLKQKCIDRLAEIAEPGTSVSLLSEEALFLEVNFWDRSDMPEEGGQHG